MSEINDGNGFEGGDDQRRDGYHITGHPWGRETRRLPETHIFGTDDVTFLANKLVEESAELMVRLKEARDSGTIGHWDRILANGVNHEVGDVVCTLSNLLEAMGMEEWRVQLEADRCHVRYMERIKERADDNE